jgi:Kdo2-lipid IVA lauroyltransferase/acyltransferase
MKRLTYLLFLFFIYTFSLTPFWALYLFSDYILFPFFYYIYRYRRNVVIENLTKSFPGKSEEEIRVIAKAYYHHFCDILVEGVKAFSMTRRQVVERYTMINPGFLQAFYDKGQSVIAVLGHYNNWEWGSIAAGLQLRHTPVALYKPLSNDLIDGYIERTRAKTGTILESIYHTTLSFAKYINDPALFLMVADQSPAKAEKSIWVNFLNQDTAVLHGAEKHAILSNIPVVYVSIRKVKRGFYTAEMSLLVEDPSQSGPGEITEKFMKALEQQIIEKPEYWLWSHKRWKYKRD